MSERTEFGKTMAIIRINHGQTMKDMANEIGVSPSMLSSVELGKKEIPHHWWHLISSKYILSDDEQTVLADSIDKSTRKIVFDTQRYTDKQRQLILTFSDYLDNFDDEDCYQLESNIINIGT